MPSPRPSETASGSHVPSGSGNAESGRPSSSPISRPMQQPDDCGDELGRRELLDLADEPDGGDDR
jgi:hypothetical protein